MFDPLFERLANRRVFALVFLFECALLWLIWLNALTIWQRTGFDILDVRFGYSLDEVNATFRAYDAQAWRAYEAIQILEFLHPVVAATLLGTLIWGLADGERWRWLALTPFMVALFDYAEAVMLWRMTVVNLPVDARTAELASAFSVIKQAGLAAVVVVLLMMFTRRLIQPLFHKA